MRLPRISIVSPSTTMARPVFASTIAPDIEPSVEASTSADSICFSGHARIPRGGISDNVPILPAYPCGSALRVANSSGSRRDTRRQTSTETEPPRRRRSRISRALPIPHRRQSSGVSRCRVRVRWRRLRIAVYGSRVWLGELRTQPVHFILSARRFGPNWIGLAAGAPGLEGSRGTIQGLMSLPVGKGDGPKCSMLPA